MSVNYAPHPQHRCPTCNSRYPERHPAMAFEGEVEICVDDFHLIPTNTNRPEYIQRVLDKRALRERKERKEMQGG